MDIFIKEKVSDYERWVHFQLKKMSVNTHFIIALDITPNLILPRFETTILSIRNQLSIIDSENYFVQMIHLIEQLHRHEIIHNDLHLGNFFVKNNIVHLGDWDAVLMYSDKKLTPQSELFLNRHPCFPSILHTFCPNYDTLYFLYVAKYELFQNKYCIIQRIEQKVKQKWNFNLFEFLKNEKNSTRQHRPSDEYLKKIQHHSVLDYVIETLTYVVNNDNIETNQQH
jgi:serine/threonine protein kinase